jgi:hypothetical protein
VLFYFAREAAGALGTRLSLRPLFFKEAKGFLHSPGAIVPRECRLTLSRHCEEQSDEAIQLLLCGAMDCFASLAMTVVGELAV